MKRFGFLFLLSALLIVFSSANTTAGVSCFEHEFIRETGEPVTETYPFSGINGSATIKIYNGAQNDYETGERVTIVLRK